jgi:hypothetical protein
MASLLRLLVPRLSHKLVMKHITTISTSKRSKDVLENLSPHQVEKAFEWLEDPSPNPPPEDLLSLSQLEWFVLRKMLDSLWEEKKQSPLQ